MGRGKVGLGGAAVCSVLARFGVLRHGNHLHGRRGRGFDAARWDESWLAKSRFSLSCRVVSRKGTSWKPPSLRNGGRSTRPGWDWLRPGWVRHARVVRCMSRLGFHHHRVGTLADRGGRGGVFAVRRCRPRLGVDRCGLKTTPVRARFPIDAGGVGCTTEWCGGVMLGMSRLGESW